MLTPHDQSPPTPLIAAPELDAEALGRLMALDPSGDSRLLERVLNAFQASAARLEPQVEAARVGGDRNAIRLVAHTLKSSSASIGALALSALCAKVESAIRTDAMVDLDTDIPAMTTELKLALQAIESLLKERAA